MNKRDKIAGFLDYGGNELFSTLMGDDINRSEGIDRLVTLLCIYSDICPLINGRSRAYRFMLFRAKERGWLGVYSNDLKSHKLTENDRERIEQTVSDYITSGGVLAKRAKDIAFALGIILVLLLAGYLTYKRLTSESHRQKLYEYYSQQIIIEYAGGSDKELEFKIHTTQNAPIYVFMEHMPKVYFITAEDETFLEIKQGKDIVSYEDERADYTTAEETLTLLAKDYDASFVPGKYRVEFEFYYQSDSAPEEKIFLPKKSVEMTL